MKKTYILLICVLLLTSCRAEMIYPAMLKDGATEQQRKTDAFECKGIAADFRGKHMGPGSPSFGLPGMARHNRQLNDATEAANQYYIECMDLRGYQVVPEKETK